MTAEAHCRLVRDQTATSDCARIPASVMALDTLLNLAWVFFAVLGSCGVSSITRASRFRRRVSFFLIALTFFPCVSANDDIIRFRDVVTPPTQTANSVVDSRSTARGADYQLQRLLEVLDHFQVRGV